MNVRATNLLAAAGGAALLSLAQPSGAVAQLPAPSAAFVAMGENHTALARGSDAVALNPAGLAMPDGPTLSASILALRGVAGLGPVGLGDLARFDGRSVPDEVRERWLGRITRAGREEGSAGAELTWMALQVGRFGLQVGTRAHFTGDLGPGAAELLLFGNAGRTGAPVDLELDGTALDVVATTTSAISYAQPLLREEEVALSVGATLTYTVGHLMVTALDQGGAATANPLEIRVELPIVQTDTEGGAAERGSGVGLDVGLAWRGGPLRAGLAMRNVFNTFAWNEDELLFRAGGVTVGGETRATNFEAQELDAAPAAVRARVRDLEFAPTVAAGIAYDIHPQFRLSADGRQRLGEGQASEPATHLGLGTEIRPFSWLPLRAGMAYISDGFLLSGGLGVAAGPVRLDGAAARKSTGLGTATILMITFSLALD
jgi:hypothetical protein